MRMTQAPSRLTATLLAFVVVTLWSSSWVLIKIGLQDIPPLTFAGLRYFLAFVVLVPFSLTGSSRRALGRLSRRSWLLLGALGLTLYAVGVGGQFVALLYLPAVTTRLLFAFNTIIVALLSGGLLRERPTWSQWVGVLVAMLGIYIYFHPVDIPASQVTGVLAALVGMLGFALGALLGRSVARSGALPPVAVTAVSMGIGSVVLLCSGLALQGLPAISASNWAIILWLSAVNTALAFVLWNHTLRTLTAVESNIITNVMVVEIAVLAWLFLGERLTAIDVVGLGLVIAGTIAVQLRSPRFDGTGTERSDQS
jgi:drug/metabolite transporter (DMT)-like permease